LIREWGGREKKGGRSWLTPFQDKKRRGRPTSLFCGYAHQEVGLPFLRKRKKKKKSVLLAEERKERKRPLRTDGPCHVVSSR